MQLNMAFFSFNNACGYIEKPSALCRLKSSFDPKFRKNIENVAGNDIYIRVISGQFLCQDREPAFVDVQMYGMYGDMTKKNEFLVRSKRWNGFQVIYDDAGMDTCRCPVKFLNVILPDMATIRFAVSSEDGTFIGQSVIPVAHLRSGYRYVVLRNQMNIPINSSILFVFIRVNIHVQPKDQALVDRLVTPSMNQSPHVNRLQQNPSADQKSPDLVASLFTRDHSASLKDSESIFSQRHEAGSLNETKWYAKHLIAASRLHEKKTLCKVLSLHDILSKEPMKRDQIIENKLRRISIDFQKVFSALNS